MAPRGPLPRWMMLQLVFVLAFVATGAVLMVVSRGSVGGWVGERQDDLISAVRFIGFLNIGVGLMFMAPIVLRRSSPTPRAWVAAVVALGSLAVALVMIANHRVFASCLWAALSFVVGGAATCFSIWRPEDLKLRAAFPERWQARLLGAR